MDENYFEIGIANVQNLLCYVKICCINVSLCKTVSLSVHMYVELKEIDEKHFQKP